MVKQILVHCERSATKVAVLENKRLVEYYVEKQREEQAGSIYKGRVVNVLPGMQAAFVDIGQARNAFLYVDDLLDANLDKQPTVKPQINELVREGQELLVQVTRESAGTKGAKVTTHYSIPGRWLVYMPLADYTGVSRKIDSAEERLRLKELGDELRTDQEGLILRTIAEHATREELLKDLNDLRDIWSSIQARSAKLASPACIHRDLDMVPRLIRDLFNEQVSELVIDNVEKRREIESYMLQYAPELASRIRDYHGEDNLAQAYGLHEMLDRAMRPKVWLDNGAYLIVDHTEALTVIDVNTGKYTGSTDLEQTVFETNLRAADEIAYLLRLRDIGGIIVIDFIDMNVEAHRQAVIERIEQRIRLDRTKTIVVGWTGLGLLEMTRKKVRSSDDKTSYETCSHCGGTGRRHIF